MADGVCTKCGFKAPAGLLKCPFCRVYIRSPGTSNELKVPELPPKPPEPEPEAPPPDPAIVRAVQRELARELFEDSSYEWNARPPSEESDPPE